MGLGCLVWCVLILVYVAFGIAFSRAQVREACFIVIWWFGIDCVSILVAGTELIPAYIVNMKTADTTISMALYHGLPPCICLFRMGLFAFLFACIRCIAFFRLFICSWRRQMEKRRLLLGDAFGWGVLPVRALDHPSLLMALPAGFRQGSPKEPYEKQSQREHAEEANATASDRSNPRRQTDASGRRRTGRLMHAFARTRTHPHTHPPTHPPTHPHPHTPTYIYIYIYILAHSAQLCTHTYGRRMRLLT